MGEWIDAKKCLPDPGVHVLVCSEKRAVQHIAYMIGVDDEGNKYWIDFLEEYDAVDLEVVTHWMTIPLPPKE